MTSAQCISGTLWLACAIDLYQLYGVSGVVSFIGTSILIGSYLYHKLFKKERNNDA